MHTGSARDTRGRRNVRTRLVSNVTLRKELTYLSGFFNWCCRQRPPFLRENTVPLSNAANIKDDAKPHFMITEDELRALLDACETPRQYLFLLLGWWTGGRRSDILGIYFYHFDFKRFAMARAVGRSLEEATRFAWQPVSDLSSELGWSLPDYQPKERPAKHRSRRT